jgi:hypothetical protein
MLSFACPSAQHNLFTHLEPLSRVKGVDFLPELADPIASMRIDPDCTRFFGNHRVSTLHTRVNYTFVPMSISVPYFICLAMSPK